MALDSHDISLTFPDGSVRTFARGSTPAEVANSIATSLGKKAISATVNGAHFDLQWPLMADAAIKINTMQDDAAALELIRHDLAHIMARAVQKLWPDVKVTIGPVIQNGWYYDFDRAEPFTPEDLGAIEKEMKAIINARDPVKTEVWDRSRAIAHYIAKNEPFKVELIDAIPGDEPLRMYWHGHWQDLCRGPHFQNTGQVPADAFKLMSVAGAYWRGDSNNKQLQRIYGVAFKTRDDLKAYLTTASLARRWSCSTCRKKRRAWCSGIRTAGRSGARWRITCAAVCAARATRRFARRRWWTACSGSAPAIGRPTARTCSSSRSTKRAPAKSASTR